MSDYKIIPSKLEYKSAPTVNQDIVISLEERNENIIEFDRNQTINLAQVYDNERQACTIFRPTVKASCIFDNTYTGKTEYLKFLNGLFYISPENSVFTNNWRGLPQYFEFDFFRPETNFDNFLYEPSKSFKYNWTYYFSYAASNNYDKELSCTLNGNSFNWKVSDGIPFVIKNTRINGQQLISFECPFNHNLLPGQSVELSFKYNNTNIFEVQSLGNDKLNSSKYIFNIYNIGYTGNTFSDGVIGVFKKVLNPNNLTETRSKYYIRVHKVLTNYDDMIVTKNGFERTPFKEQLQLELSSLTPNKIGRISKKTSNNTYIFTSKKDLNFFGMLDNQKRPITEIFFTTINKGYNGYFNKPFNFSGLKQGWRFNITETSNSWWQDTNIKSNTNIKTNSYIKTSGVTKTFYYNNDLKIDDLIDGDLCEWNDFDQNEKVLSELYHKIKYNQDVFQTEDTPSGNSKGFYYKPHHSIQIRTFSTYIERENASKVDLIPSYCFYSKTNNEFRWRDLYSYGFIDELNVGVDYPYLNNAHYPYNNIIFKIIPEGSNYNVTGSNIPYKPIIDECE